jgi:hypothetical protein
MTYVASAFEQEPLALGFPSAQMRDRWNTSLDGWETDIAKVVAHLTSAIGTIAGHVANTSDPVVDLMFLELDEAGHCVQRALPALDAFSRIARLRSGWPPSLGALKCGPRQRDALSLDVGPSHLLASSIGKEPEGTERGEILV